MVVFTCNNCGDSLQKPKVAKHFQFQCRNPIALTCVDCLKDFLNDEYVAHTKCVTEAERYGGKNFVPKPSANKGEKKQQEWINIVNSVLTSSTILTNEERNFLQSIAKYDNIPRKKAKYLNFIKNALGYRVNYNTVESCWEKMESAYKEITDNYKKNKSSNNNETSKNSSNCSNNNNSDDVTRETKDNNSKSGLEKSKKKNSKDKQVIHEEKQDNEVVDEKLSKKKKRKNVNHEEMNGNDNEIDEAEKKSKSKKRKLNKSEATSENGSCKETCLSNGKKIENGEENKVSENLSEKSQTFEWKSEILQIFGSKQEISLKKLKKKIFQKYLSVYPDVPSDKIESRFNKKLKKMSQLTISDDRVKLTM